MNIWTLANNKGGITKTTSTINLGYGIARLGYRVLIIDADAQCNSTYTLTGQMEHQKTLHDVLLQGTNMNEIIIPTKQENLFLAPSSILLSAADLLLGPVVGRERKLVRALGSISDYDYVLIDTPPNLGILTINAFLASTAVIIPIALTTYALIGIGILEDTMQKLRENMEVELPILGVIANLDDHTRISASMLTAVREHFGDLVFQTVIPRNIKVEEAHNQLDCLYDYAPQSKGAIAYTALVKEVLSRATKG